MAGPLKKLVLFIIIIHLVILKIQVFAGKNPPETQQDMIQNMKEKYRILYESYRENNFEICSIAPDGTDFKNLTNTPEIHEFYPKASPDGSQICFMAYEGEGKSRKRCLFLMDHEGKNRKKIADGRWPCWSPDGKTIAFVKEYLPRFNMNDYATKGLYFYDLETEEEREYSSKYDIQHVYNLSWHKNGYWISAVVHGGLGQSHAIIVLDIRNDAFKKILGGNRCRPDFSPDGSRLAWCDLDWAIGVGNLWLQDGVQVKQYRQIVETIDHERIYAYHPDWSPDGVSIVYGIGPGGPGMPRDTKSPGTGYSHPAAIGVKADGWDIYIVPADGGPKFRVTRDGMSNKEPDWIKLPSEPERL